MESIGELNLRRFKFNLKRFVTFGIVVLVLIIAGIFWWNISIAPADSTNAKTQSFIIDRGDGVREIAKKLRDRGLIKDQIAFFILVKNLGIEKDIQAGSFKLSPAMSASELAKKLTVGTEDIWITIPEGTRSEQILTYLKEQKIDDGNWTVASQIPIWRKDEGKFFPETYLVPKLWTIDQIRQHLIKTFNQKFDENLVAEAKKKNLSQDQVVTLASIVEREAGSSEDMPIVAGILLNRLNDDHALQTDATIHYMLGTAKNDWWPKEVLSEDLKIPNPYNTYLNPGLPPGPIGNPGLTSIKAVLNPQKSTYFYYISDKDGNMHYAVTLEQHNDNVAKYID